jgi:hypothetical protein
MRALVAGWFSFEGMGASAGDVLVRDLACAWLARAGVAHDVANAPPFPGGVDWRDADPARYDVVLFVCGPFGDGPPVAELLEKFRGRRLVGLDLTMLEPLERFDPFDRLWERDSSRTARPDLAFATAPARVPVVGVVLIDTQPEYGTRDRSGVAHGKIEVLLAGREVAALRIDTRLDRNAAGLKSAAEVESLIARTDAVITTRLHGLVLALKCGVPAVAIDSVQGGGKVRRQAETLGWPVHLAAEVTAGELRAALDHALTEDARRAARACRDRAARAAAEVGEELIAALAAWRREVPPPGL